jgi:hypothetical protein
MIWLTIDILLTNDIFLFKIVKFKLCFKIDMTIKLHNMRGEKCCQVQNSPPTTAISLDSTISFYSYPILRIYYQENISRRTLDSAPHHCFPLHVSMNLATKHSLQHPDQHYFPTSLFPMHYISKRHNRILQQQIFGKAQG